MNERSVEQVAFVGALLASGAALARISFFPAKVPAAPRFSTALLQHLGERGWQGIQISDAQRGRDLSRGDEYRFQSNQQHLASIILVPVRVRDSEDLSVNRLARLLNWDITGKSTQLDIKGDTFQLTLGPNNSTSLRGCIAAGSAQIGPKGLVATNIAADPIVSALERMKVLLGLRMPRDLSCLFVKIEIVKSNDAETVLKRIWRSTGTVITASTQAEAD